jgi:hypothetical protein
MIRRWGRWLLLGVIAGLWWLGTALADLVDDDGRF